MLYKSPIYLLNFGTDSKYQLRAMQGSPEDVSFFLQELLILIHIILCLWLCVEHEIEMQQYRRVSIVTEWIYLLLYNK